MSNEKEDAGAFPDEEQVRAAALRALGEVRPVNDPERYEWAGGRTNAGRNLPEPYLVYFLLVDFLKFPSTGIGEKVAWTVPLAFRDTIAVVSHRKFGIGVFGTDEETAREVTNRIQKAVKEARPFFDWLALQAVTRSSLNVVNNANSLFDRFEYLLKLYREKCKEAEDRKDEKVVTEVGNMTSVTFPAYQLGREARWLALSVVEAFFSWTEHVLIHLAIITGQVRTGLEVSELAAADWETKFKTALDVNDRSTKSLFDQLVEIRRELRNFVAHGAFGKKGQAFHFHSSAGAVPVVLPHRAGSRRFSIAGADHFDHEAALSTFEQFIKHLWSGTRTPARLYIQESHLPLILTMASDGRYSEAMQSENAMNNLIDRLNYESDTAANMDW